TAGDSLVGGPETVVSGSGGDSAGSAAVSISGSPTTSTPSGGPLAAIVPAAGTAASKGWLRSSATLAGECEATLGCTPGASAGCTAGARSAPLRIRRNAPVKVIPTTKLAAANMMNWACDEPATLITLGIS